VAIDAAGQVYVDGAPVDAAALADHFRTIVARGSGELQLRADRGTRYERVAEILADAQRAGLTRIAFVTDPSR